MGEAGKSKKYTLHSLKEAVDKVNNKELALNQASRIYGIPRATLFDKVNLRTPLTKSSPGPDPYISTSEETRLCEWIKAMSTIGYGKTRQEIPYIVKEILDKANKETKFKDNLPSQGWMAGFLNRHPEISGRIPEHLGHQRTFISHSKIKTWFDDLTSYMQTSHQINAKEFFTDNNSLRIWNADETGFPLSGSSGRLQVLSSKGSKNVYNRGSDSKEQITVLGCCAASGLFVKPLVIYPGKSIRLDLHDIDVNLFDAGKSEKGWISTDIFFEWVANSFYPYVKNVLDVQFPIVLFVDGHKSHINLGTSAFCSQKGIILYCFKAHASHIQQPLDIAVYGPLKQKWNLSVRKWTTENPGKTLTRTKFLHVFLKAWEDGTSSENAQAGFRAAGLVPFDLDAIDTTKFLDYSATSKYQMILNETFNNTNETSPSHLQSPPLHQIQIESFETIKRHVQPYLREFEEHFTNNQGNCLSDTKAVLFNIYSEFRKKSETTPEGMAKSSLTSTSVPNTTSIVPSVASASGIATAENRKEIINDISFSHYDSSPFKSHLKLPDDLRVESTSKGKGKCCLRFPDVVSGKEMLTYMQKKDNDKKKNETEKLARKKEREEKKKLKEEENENKLKKRKAKGAKTKNTKRKIEQYSDTDEDSISFSESESEDYLDEESLSEICKICHSKKGENIEWIGCDLCSQWFHIACVGMKNQMRNLTEKEINSVEFICDSCEKELGIY